jgi:3-(3-hydroxy-phenyl)propionate hydroxylase
MRVGRVFFAGDAAHALPIYGARGMNSGIQDADNLAWKLAYVLNGYSDERLLDTYHDERHAAARENLGVTEATIRFMVPAGRLRRSLRNLLLRLALPVKPLRERVNSGRMAEPYVYDRSPIVDSAHRHPLLGVLAPDLEVVVQGVRTRLRRLFGRKFVLLYFAPDAAAGAHFLEDCGRRGFDVPLRLVVVLPASSHPGPEDEAVVVEAEPVHSDAYRTAETAWYLVRPDGHIAAARENSGVAELVDLLLACARVSVEPAQTAPTSLVAPDSAAVRNG